MLLLFSIFMACNTQEQSAKDQVIVVDKHSAPSKDDFQKHAFFCCSDAKIQTVVDAYIGLNDALANDNTTLSPQLGTAFLDLATQYPSLKEESETIRPLWTDMDGIRSNLSDISILMISLAKKHKSDSGQKIITAFCPMAPGRWLQKKNVVHNPYYGSKMLTCGVFE
ncbi:MAG: hypothetical protein VX278_11990 [Myxococcota bacterium]|nr:hypothetical protein [Myxococcota bacterium]